MLRLIIGGDMAPTESNFGLFNSVNIVGLFGEDLLDILKKADFRIFNLEAPLTNQETPIAKCGPSLIAPINTIMGIKYLNPSLLTLANNHILDQGEQGLYSAIKVLEEKSIDYVGAGSNLDEAVQPYILEKDGILVGFYACAEHEFTIATKNSPGANPFDPLESLDHIKDLARRCDYIIVLYHGGKEHYRYPSPYLQKICRKIIDKGADLVVCQHSHCIGTFEEYNGGTIVYGQGNFLFDDSDSEYWQTSLLIKVSIEEKFNIEYIPIVKKENAVCLATNGIAEEILKMFYKRSDEMLQEGFIEQEYQKFADKNVESYLRSFSGFGKWLSRIDRYLLRGALVKNKYNKNQLLAIQNYIECEAHRELVLAGLKSCRK